MKTLHSIGPWKISPYGYSDGSQIWSDKIVNGDQKHICNVFSNAINGVNGCEPGRYSRIDEVEQKANAKLIAAAPDLLGALSSLVLSVTAHPDYTGQENAEWTDLISIAEKAIKKATDL